MKRFLLIVTCLNLWASQNVSAMRPHGLKQAVSALAAIKTPQSNWAKIAHKQTETVMVRCNDGAIVSVNARRFPFFNTLRQYHSPKTLTIDQLDSLRLQKASEVDAELAQHNTAALHSLSTDELSVIFKDLSYLQADEIHLKTIANELVERRKKQELALDPACCYLIDIYRQADIETLVASGKIGKARITMIQEQCTCDLSHLQLSNLKGIESIWDLWPETTSDDLTLGDYQSTDVTCLDLSYNKLTHLSAADLKRIKRLFPSITSLCFDHNLIDSISSDALSEMDGLKISLNSNPLDIDLALLVPYENINLSIVDTPTALKHVDFNNWKQIALEDGSVVLEKLAESRDIRSVLIRSVLAPALIRILVKIPAVNSLASEHRSAAELFSGRCQQYHKIAHFMHMEFLMPKMHVVFAPKSRDLFLKSLKNLSDFVFNELLLKSALTFAVDTFGYLENNNLIKAASCVVDPFGYALSLPIDFLIKTFYKRYKEPFQPCTIRIR